jgi:ribosomal protein S12 methylthiotransferase accessory factor
MTGPAHPETAPLSDVFLSCAAVLAGTVGADERALEWLHRLGYRDGAASLISHRARILRAAARFNRVFTLDSPDAPGLTAVGAEADPAYLGLSGQTPGGVAGKGVTFQSAFEGCIGEGVEYLSSFLRPGASVERLRTGAAIEPGPLTGLWDSLRPFLRRSDAEPIDWTVAVDLANGRPVRLPLDLCLRRPVAERDIDIPWPLSIGCAAGTDAISATVAALLELIERHAVTAWWNEGCPGRAVALDSPAAGAGSALLTRLRGAAGRRLTWLLDITPADLRVPCVAAVSCDPGGRGVCLGFAASLTAAGAARGAVLELAQLELGYRLVETKLALRGEASLNEADRRARRRFTELDAAALPALRPDLPPEPASDLPARDASEALLLLRQRLGARGLAPCVLNLTCPEFEIPVVRAVCPGLRIAAALAREDRCPAGIPPF